MRIKQSKGREILHAIDLVSGLFLPKKAAYISYFTAINKICFTWIESQIASITIRPSRSTSNSSSLQFHLDWHIIIIKIKILHNTYCKIQILITWVCQLRAWQTKKLIKHWQTNSYHRTPNRLGIYICVAVCVFKKFPTKMGSNKTIWIFHYQICQKNLINQKTNCLKKIHRTNIAG